MKFTLAAFAMAAAGANALTTVSAPCGTSCPTAIPDRMITRSMPVMTESTPCPSLIVSKLPGAGNGTNPMMTGMMTGVPSPTPSSFTGGAGHIAGSVGGVVAAMAAVLAL